MKTPPRIVGAGVLRLLAPGQLAEAPAAPIVATHESRAAAGQAVDALQAVCATRRRLAIVASDSWTEECAFGTYAAGTHSPCGAGRAALVTLGKLERGAIAERLMACDVPAPEAVAHEASVRAGKVLVVVLGTVALDAAARGRACRARHVASARWRRA